MSFRYGVQPPPASRNTATIGLIVALAAAFVLNWLPGFGDSFRNIAVLSLAAPWAAPLYPFAFSGNGGELFFFLFSLLWLFFVGNALESTVGKVGLVVHFFAAALVHGLVALAAFAALAPVGVLMGPGLPLAFLTVLYAARAPEQSIMFWGIFPLKLKWLAILVVALTIFGYGTGNPLLGILLALPCALAWVYGQDRIPGFRLGRPPFEEARQKQKENKRFDEFFGKVRDRAKERDERERLRKLFESSVKEDPKDNPEAR